MVRKNGFVCGVLRLLAAVFCVGLVCCGFAGCGDGLVNEGDLLKLEAEEAVVEGSPSSGSLFCVMADSRSTNVTANAKYLTNLDVPGNRVTWFFNADKDGATDLYLSVANATAGAGEFSAGGAARKVFGLEVNGTEVPVPDSVVRPAGRYCDAWQLIKIPDVGVVAGCNTAVLRIFDTTGAVNVDYLAADVRKKNDIQKHTHDWRNETVLPDCTAQGQIYRECRNCGFRYLYAELAAHGHEQGDYHYDAASGKMRSECLHCGGNILYAEKPAGYFGEMYANESGYAGTVRAHRTVFEAEDAAVLTPGGLHSGTSPIETVASASGGKSVGNISKSGNYIRFDVESAAACRADIVLVLANVRWAADGILALAPMSDFVSFKLYNSVTGTFFHEVQPDGKTAIPAAKAANRQRGREVNFDFVNFPETFRQHDYFMWRHVVIRDVALVKGENTLVFRPEGTSAVTIPNTDVLYIHTDGASDLQAAG